MRGAILGSLFFLATLVSVSADEQIKNPDFIDGHSHWEGDGESAAAAGGDNSNPLATADSSQSPSGGMLFKLSGRDWLKITQDFRPLIAAGTLTITYKLSDDFAFSSDYDDYKNVPQSIDYGSYEPFDIPRGTWVVTFLEQSTTELKYYVVKPKAGTDPQTYTVRIEGLIIRDDKVLCLAFPPGKGTLTLLHVGFSDK
jgi:hypothetical protein